jgi:hypothetical protein
MVEILKKESDLITGVNRTLKEFKKLGMLDYRRIHVEGIPTRSGYGRRRNPQKGMSDFLIVANGWNGWVECKKPGEKLSDEQKEFIMLQYKHGCQKVAVIETLEELFTFLRKEMQLYV